MYAWSHYEWVLQLFNPSQSKDFTPLYKGGGGKIAPTRKSL